MMVEFGAAIEGATPAAYRVGDLVVDIARERVVRDGHEILLAKLSFDLLAALVRASPELVSVDRLMSQVWPGLVVGPETVVQRVKLVRAALGDDPKQPRYIEGVRGRGYRLAVPAIALTPEAMAALSSGSSTAAPPATERRIPRLAFAAVLLLTVASASVLWLVRRPDAMVPTPRVAVLPFENLSAEPDNAFFADGVHQEIISALTESAPSLSAVARTTMMTYRDRPRLRAGEVGKELGATHVIEGTMQRDPAGVRLTVTLIDTGSEATLWSKRYERTAADVPSLRSDVAFDVANRLVVGTRERPKAITRNAEAYDLYLRALVARQSTAGPYAPVDAFDSVARLLAAAMERDPDFAAAYAERLGLNLAVFADNVDTSEAQVSRIRSDLRALERLAPDEPKTLAARALFAALIEGDFAGASRLFAAAEAAGFAEPPWVNLAPAVLKKLGRYEDALGTWERLMTLDSASSSTVGAYAFELALFNRPAEALQLLDLGIANSPTDLRLQWLRASVLFSFTGESHHLATVLEHPTLDAFSRMNGFPLSLGFLFLRWGGRIDEFEDLLRHVQEPTVRARFTGVGREPVARYRGWVALLRGDAEAASEEGRRVLDFLASTDETEHNRSFRGLLAAEAHTFIGEPARALDAMHETNDLRIDVTLDFAKSQAAVYAWAGAEDEAVTLLEALSTRLPRIGPAEVVRDPLFTIPLADNARFAGLAARLDAALRAQEGVGAFE